MRKNTSGCKCRETRNATRYPASAFIYEIMKPMKWNVSEEMVTDTHTYMHRRIRTLARDYIDNDSRKSDRFRDRRTALIIPFNGDRNGIGTAFAIKLSFQLPLRSINVQSIPRNSIISCKSPPLRSLRRPSSSFAFAERGRARWGKRRREIVRFYIYI